MNSVELAKLFHETYERLAPSFGYETRSETAVPWEQIPANNPNKQLMIAVTGEIIHQWPQPERIILSLYTALTLYPRVMANGTGEESVVVERFMVRMPEMPTFLNACAFAFIVVRGGEVQTSIICNDWGMLESVVLAQGRYELLHDPRWHKAE
jgi:hypothetical protein